MTDRRRPSSILQLFDIPFGFAVGDLDGDGDRDMVATQPNVTLLFRREAGEFGAPETLTAPTGSLPGQRPLVVDVDGDGTLDIVIGPNGVPSSLAVYITNSGLGGTIATLPSVLMHAFACGDIDADGDLDLVVARPAITPATQGLLVLRQAFSTFQIDSPAMPANQPLGMWPVLADVDADGDLDVIAVGAPSGFRFLRNINGVFQNATAALPATGFSRHHAVAGDFDADGRTDIAALDAQGSIDLLWSTNAGFVYQPSILGSGFTSLEAGDIDADGDADLVGFNSGFELLRSNGNRTFTSEPRAGDPTTRTAGSLADLDGDGRLDVLTAYNNNPPRVRCAYGGSLLEDVAAELGLRPSSDANVAAPLAGDFDGDGRTDVLLVKDGVLDVQLARGAGRFISNRSTTPMGAQVIDATSGDFDRDGDLDVAVLTPPTFYLWANDGAANFSALTSITPLSPAIDRSSIATGDFDRDGNPDFLFLTDSALLRVPGQPGGTWGQPTVAHAIQPLGAMQSFTAADFDGDGDLDVATTEPFASGTLLLVNNGIGTLTPSPTPIPLPVTPFFFFSRIANGDVDNDGDVDLVGTGLAGQIQLTLNQGNGTFVDRTSTNMPSTAVFQPLTGLFVQDIDEDGDRDVIVSSQFGNEVLINTGNGHFALRTSGRIQNLAFAGNLPNATLDDLDDDGDLDLWSDADQRFLLVDHLRHLVSNAMPRLGGTLPLTIYSGPGFGLSGVSFVAAAPNLLASPIAVPGLRGKLELDPSSALLIAIEPADVIGVAQTFVPVPPTPQLIGVEVFLQAAIVPFAGTPSLTNCIVERVPQ